MRKAEVLANHLQRVAAAGAVAVGDGSWLAPDTLPFILYLQTESVVMSKLSDEKGFILDFVNNAVFVVCAPRPVARQRVLQRFRFTNPFKRGALNVLNEQIDPFQ